MIKTLLLVAIVIACLNFNNANLLPQMLYDIPLNENPAFVKVLPNPAKLSSYGTTSHDLGITSFTGNLFKKDKVLTVNDVSEYEYFNPSSTFKNYLTENLEWPNEIDTVPDGIFQSRVLSVASGFFLPGKDNGSIALIDMKNPDEPVLYYISKFDPSQNWFYHRVLWMDMNKDGHLDALTAKAWGAGDKAEEAQLLWLENPGLDTPSSGWSEHILHEDTIEVSFTVHELQLENGVMTPVIIGSGFWSKELTLIWSSVNDWTDSNSIKTLVIDTHGWYFDVQVADLNKDGRMDLLTTTWSQLGDPGALLAYEIPDDWQIAEKWNKIVIRDDYKSFKLPGKGSPGTAQAFWPNSKNTSCKPYILVSGDDDGNYFIERPMSQDVNDWTYEKTVIYEQPSGTVGSFSIYDVNDDNFVEIYLAIYQNSFVRVMTYGDINE